MPCRKAADSFWSAEVASLLISPWKCCHCQDLACTENIYTHTHTTMKYFFFVTGQKCALCYHLWYFGLKLSDPLRRREKCFRAGRNSFGWTQSDFAQFTFVQNKTCERQARRVTSGVVVDQGWRNCSRKAVSTQNKLSHLLLVQSLKGPVQRFTAGRRWSWCLQKIKNEASAGHCDVTWCHVLACITAGVPSYQDFL